jgi:DNA-binding PadR family transcriptional regulator
MPVVVVEPETKKTGQGGLRFPAMAKHRQKRLSTADLVVLSLLAEGPMHGYQVNAELQRRQVRDWAGISRPQVYYSLEKLSELKLLRRLDPGAESRGPERRRFEATATGLGHLAAALESNDWCTKREKPPFLTWMALSWQARRGVFDRQLRSREGFLRRELRKEQATLAGVLAEVGHPYHEAVWMIQLAVAQFKTELRWISRLKTEKSRRASARHYQPSGRRL